MNKDEQIILEILRNIKIDGMTLGRHTENHMLTCSSSIPITDTILFGAEFLVDNDKNRQIIVRWDKNGKIYVIHASRLTGALLSNPHLARLAERYSKKRPDIAPMPIIDSMTSLDLETEIRDAIVLVSKHYAKALSPKAES